MKNQPLGRGPECSRRTVLCGVTVGGVAIPTLSACGGNSSASDTKAVASDATTSGAASLAESDVPVGGGTILKDANVVVTQPTKGEFKAFTAICTHQGCPVSSVEAGEIVCACHGSHFSIEDGAVISGPAPAPLDEMKISVSGGQITAG